MELSAIVRKEGGGEGTQDRTQESGRKEGGKGKNYDDPNRPRPRAKKVVFLRLRLRVQR